MADTGKPRTRTPLFDPDLVAHHAVALLGAALYLALPMVLLVISLQGAYLGTVLLCWAYCSFATYLYGLRVASTTWRKEGRFAIDGTFTSERGPGRSLRVPSREQDGSLTEVEGSGP